MGNKQPMQSPSLATPIRWDKDNRAVRCAKYCCCHASKRARPENLRTHHDHSGMAFRGFFDNGRCSRAQPVLDYEPRHIFI
jgi:hypothetical protein